MTTRKVELARSFLGNWRRNKYLRRQDKRPYLKKGHSRSGKNYADGLGGFVPRNTHSAVAALMLFLLTIANRKSFFRRKH